MSDYDILVVTSTRFQRYIINHILSKATDNYYKGKNRYVSTTVQFIDESIDDLNKAIDKTDISILISSERVSCFTTAVVISWPAVVN